MESGDNALLPRTHRLVLSEQNESNGFLHSIASGFARGASPRQVAHSVGMTRRAASSDPMAEFRISDFGFRISRTLHAKVPTLS